MKSPLNQVAADQYANDVNISTVRSTVGTE